MKCLVTGAGGFIGSALCRELAGRGHDLVALVRNAARAPAGAEVLCLELGAEPVAHELLRGIDVVYHCAGIAHRAAGEEDYRRVNHEATLQLAAAAEAAGVSRFVFLSSVKAASSTTPYGIWKQRSEQALATASADYAMSITSLRPALVYGPGVRGNLRALVRAVRRHLPMPPTGGARSMVSLVDLVDALCRLGERDASGYACYELSDGQKYTTRRMYQAILAGLGEDPRRAWLPRPAWRLACVVLDLARSEQDESTYQKLFGEELVSNVTLCTALDWRPRHTLETQMEDILRGGA